MSAVIPETFGEWHRCIEHDCGIRLTEEFIQGRLMVLRDSQHEETQRFIRHYGEAHWQRTVSWFERANVDIRR